MSNVTDTAATVPARRDLLTGIALVAATATATAASLPTSEAAARSTAKKASARRAKPVVDGDHVVTREGVRLSLIHI